MVENNISLSSNIYATLMLYISLLIHHISPYPFDKNKKRRTYRCIPESILSMAQYRVWIERYEAM